MQLPSPLQPNLPKQKTPSAQYHFRIMLNALTMLAVFLTDAQQHILVDKFPSVTIARDCFDKWTLFFSGLLAVAGLLGIFLAWRTVTATRDAAEAALLNAQAVINAERASLLFTTMQVPVNGRHGFSIFQIYAKNFGKVPARQVSISNPTEKFTAFPDNLPEPPTDTAVIQFLEYLAPDDSILIAKFYPSKDGYLGEKMLVSKSEGVSSDDVRAIIFGSLSYRDGISSKTRHSRYCYRHEKGQSTNIGGSIVSCGPKSYTECT